MSKKDIVPGEFTDEDAVVMTNPEDEKEFDDGVSVSFLRFENEDGQSGEDEN